MRHFLGDYTYRFYLVVLKLVLTIVPTISIVLVVLNLFFYQNDYQVNSIQFFSMILLVILRNWISVVISCIFLVSAVFVLLKICHVEIGEEKIESLEHLFKRSKTSSSISMIETILEMLGIIFLVWHLYFNPEYISSYSIKDNRLIPLTPLFNSSVLIFYHPMIIAVYSVGFILSIGKLLIRRWSLGLAILHFVYKAGVCLLLCFFIMNQSVFNPEFFEEIFIYPPQKIMLHFDIFSNVIIAIIIGITFFDVIRPFSKVIKEI